MPVRLRPLLSRNAGDRPSRTIPGLHTGVYAVGMKALPQDDLRHVLAQAGPLWNRLDGKKIFITGGTGFFGIWLLESFLHCIRSLGLKAEACVLCRNPQAFCGRFPHLSGEAAIRFVQGDVRSFALPNGEFDYVIHAAAPSTSSETLNPHHLLSTLVDGTRNVLALANARHASRVLLVSSGAVYGPQPEALHHIPEDYRGGPDWLDPNAVYAEGKRISEQICSLWARESGTQFLIARCFAFVGPHLPLDQHFAIGNFIGDALAGRNLVIRGDGSPMRSYLYAADLAVWLWTLLLTDRESEQRPVEVNVGSGAAVSICDLARMVIDELNPGLSIEIARKPVPGSPRLQYVPDVSRAEVWFGLHQQIGLREAIRRTADWYR